MKVTFVLPGGGRSGGVKCTVKAANGLLQKGHSVRLLVNKNNPSIRSQLRNLWLRSRYPHGNDWLDMLEGAVERFNNIEKCAFLDNEIVVAAGWWAGMEMRRLQHPNIIKVHYIHGVGFHDNDKMRAVWGENVPKIAIASYLEEVMGKTCGQRIMAVIPNGIDTNEYYPSIPEDQRNGVGTIFGIGYHKDPETILGVLKTLHKDCPSTPQRVFGSCRRPMEIAKELYRRLPSLEEIRDIYSQSLVWIMGSCSEGFGLPILEAMACGCAVVATDCGGPRDIIQDGENGFLVEVGNVQKIVERVKVLLENGGLRQRFVEKSRETVSKFSWDSSVDKLEEVLNRLSRNGCDDGENGPAVKNQNVPSGQ